MSKSWSHALVFASVAGVLAGCSTVPNQTPARAPIGVAPKSGTTGSDPALPWEPPSRSGNPDSYVVFGKRYQVQETSAGHREIGTASWYGWDFHGRKTSSGPPYNMFELTAAHKSLPLPTYARVTNLNNHRSIVVKINDRGPFVGERIIDLSYAAAAQLDMLDQGTASVEVVALAPYQFLPALAARRAQKREQIASRAVELMNRQEKVAALHFAHETAVAGRPTAKPPAALQDKALRLAKNTAPVKDERPRRVAATKIQLAAATPVVKAKPATAKSQASDNRVAAVSKNNALYVVGTVTERHGVRQVQSRLSSQMQRTVEVGSSIGKQYEVRVPLRNPSEAKQVAMRLASLGVSRSRVVAD